MSATADSRRTMEQWLDLITEARKSGLTDREWCRRNSINHYSFSSAIKRLRKNACKIPARTANDLVDFTNTTPMIQEIVKVGVRPEVLSQSYSSEAVNYSQKDLPAVEISFAGSDIRIYNNASSAIISSLIAAVRDCL